MKKTLLIFAAALIILTAFGCRSKAETESGNPQNLTTPATMQTEPQKGDTIALMETSEGDIKILLYAEKVPEMTKNFIELSNQGKYEGVIFHRIIEGFMIQGGDIENKDGFGGYSYKGPGTKLEDEFGEGLTHIRGAVSMANAGPDTNGSQFFIVHSQSGTKALDPKHAVFGFVYEGMDIVDKIAEKEVDGNDKPLEDIIIEKIEISTY